MNTVEKCLACAHSYMEPDSGLLCGHPDAGTFGLLIKIGRTPRESALAHCPSFSKFEQHPLRTAVGQLLDSVIHLASGILGHRMHDTPSGFRGACGAATGLISLTGEKVDCLDCLSIMWRPMLPIALLFADGPDQKFDESPDPEMMKQ
jgi:hypothetical protein